MKESEKLKDIRLTCLLTQSSWQIYNKNDFCVLTILSIRLSFPYYYDDAQMLTLSIVCFVHCCKYGPFDAHKSHTHQMSFTFFVTLEDSWKSVLVILSRQCTSEFVICCNVIRKMLCYVTLLSSNLTANFLKK